MNILEKLNNEHSGLNKIKNFILLILLCFFILSSIGFASVKFSDSDISFKYYKEKDSFNEESQTLLISKTNNTNKKSLKKINQNRKINKRKYTNHAKQRMKERGVSKKSVEEAINKGTKKKGNKKGTIEYHLSSKQSSTKNGLTVITNKKGDVITVINKGTNYKGIK